MPVLLENEPFLEAVLENKLYVAQNLATVEIREDFTIFTTENKLSYFPFCDDFGPMNVGSIIKFIGMLDEAIGSSIGKIVYVVDGGRRALTNAGMRPISFF